jgi:GAF domain-containing protein
VTDRTLSRKEVKARRRKTTKAKPNSALMPGRRGYSSAADLQEQLDRRTRELDEALAHQAATSALEGRTIQVADVLSDPEYTLTAIGHKGYRTILGVPLLREGVVIGVVVAHTQLGAGFH